MTWTRSVRLPKPFEKNIKAKKHNKHVFRCILCVLIGGNIKDIYRNTDPMDPGGSPDVAIDQSSSYWLPGLSSVQQSHIPWGTNTIKQDEIKHLSYSNISIDMHFAHNLIQGGYSS